MEFSKDKFCANMFFDSEDWTIIKNKVEINTDETVVIGLNHLFTLFDLCGQILLNFMKTRGSKHKATQAKIMLVIFASIF